MFRVVAVSMVLAVPGVGLAAGAAHLLEKQLTVTLGQTGDGAAPPADTLTPPPPPPPSDATAADAPTAESAAPGANLELAPVERDPGPSGGLGFLITGGVCGGFGVIWTIYSVVFFAAPPAGIPRAEATSDAIVYLVFAAISLGVGIPLFIVGLNRRSERTRFLEQHPEVTWFQPGTEGRIAIATF